MWIPITSFLILLFALISQINADEDNDVKMGTCSYSTKTDLELTHVKYIWTNTNGKIMKLTECKKSSDNKYSPCMEHGSQQSSSGLRPFLFLSVRQLKMRLVNDVEYMYNENVMKMSNLPDPRTMYSDPDRFNDNGLLALKSFTLGGRFYDACKSNNVALGIAEHGLYIVNSEEGIENFRFHKIYYEPMELGEFIVYT